MLTQDLLCTQQRAFKDIILPLPEKWLSEIALQKKHEEKLCCSYLAEVWAGFNLVLFTVCTDVACWF